MMFVTKNRRTCGYFVGILSVVLIYVGFKVTICGLVRAVYIGGF